MLNGVNDVPAASKVRLSCVPPTYSTLGSEFRLESNVKARYAYSEGCRRNDYMQGGSERQVPRREAHNYSGAEDARESVKRANQRTARGQSIAFTQRE